MNHILQVGAVVRKIGPLTTTGYGKKRAWCPRCLELKDRHRFHRLYWVPHPDSETGLYVEGHSEYTCADCVRKHRALWFMPRKEYEKRLRETIKRAFEEEEEEIVKSL
jgi:hypothetical protein